MFTGIVEELGKIQKISTLSGLKQIKIEANKVLQDLKSSDSVLINGVCLTVVNRNKTFFTVEVIKETLKETNLRKLKSGDRVNLERAMKLEGRLGGHIVLGHVDGLAKIVKKQKLAKEVSLWLKTDLKLFKHIVQKSSIALEGVSLTVAEIQAHLFKVALIPYTLKETTFIEKKIGDELNLELDYLRKYVQKYQLRGDTK